MSAKSPHAAQRNLHFSHTPFSLFRLSSKPRQCLNFGSDLYRNTALSLSESLFWGLSSESLPESTTLVSTLPATSKTSPSSAAMPICSARSSPTYGCVSAVLLFQAILSTLPCLQSSPPSASILSASRYPTSDSATMPAVFVAVCLLSLSALQPLWGPCD